GRRVVVRGSSGGRRRYPRSRPWTGSRAQAPRDVDDRHKVKLHPAEGLGLVKPEQPALMQELLVVADEHAGILGALARSRALGASPRRSRRRRNHDAPAAAACPPARCDRSRLPSTLRAFPCAAWGTLPHVATDGEAAPRAA